MKTIEELNKMILDITTKIDTEYPELSKYIKEMPVNVYSGIQNSFHQNLIEYYASLESMMLKYAKNHSELHNGNNYILLNYPVVNKYALYCYNPSFSKQSVR